MASPDRNRKQPLIVTNLINLHINLAHSTEPLFGNVLQFLHPGLYCPSSCSVIDHLKFFLCCCVCVQAKGFELSYLEKVPEVKDTVHKQSLLHHVCSIVVEKFPESTDLYSEIGAITRLTKVQIKTLFLFKYLNATGIFIVHDSS